MHAMEPTSERSTLALKPTTDLNRSISCPRKGLMLSKIKEKRYIKYHPLLCVLIVIVLVTSPEILISHSGIFSLFPPVPTDPQSPPPPLFPFARLTYLPCTELPSQSTAIT